MTSFTAKYRYTKLMYMYLIKYLRMGLVDTSNNYFNYNYCNLPNECDNIFNQLPTMSSTTETQSCDVTINILQYDVMHSFFYS